MTQRPIAAAVAGQSQRWLSYKQAAGAIALAMACTVPAAATLTGRVVGVADGDTLSVLTADRTVHKVRLAAIDAPERSQPFGERARQSLSELAFGREARAFCPKTDRYGRAVCEVTVDGADVGLQQLRRGLAWHYIRYASEQSPAQRSAYAGAELRARDERSGLWTAGDPEPPWSFRRSKRAAP